MNNIHERNIFEEISKSIIDKSSNIKVIYENVPFVYENIKVESSLDINSNITILSSIGATITGGATISNNIFNKINKNSKNLSNLKIENGD